MTQKQLNELVETYENGNISYFNGKVKTASKKDIVNIIDTMAAFYNIDKTIAILRRALDS